MQSHFIPKPIYFSHMQFNSINLCKHVFKISQRISADSRPQLRVCVYSCPVTLVLETIQGTLYISHSQLMHLRYCDHAQMSFHINTMGPFLFLKFSLFLLVRVASKYRNPRLLQLKHKADLWELYSVQAIKQLHRVGFLLKSNTLGGKPSQFCKVT